jgi:hypothetical protein
MPATRDITGRRFSSLVAVRRTGTDRSGHAVWLFRCDCGREKEIRATHVTGGTHHTCGHWLNKHGQSGTRLYRTWLQMKRRCETPVAQSYYRYGGRGIKVCSEWQDFVVFADWARSHGYDDTLEIDRLDNDGNYEPANCRFVTRTANNQNKANVRRYLIRGETLSIREAAEKYGIPIKAMKKRLLNWADTERAISEPLKTRRRS